MNCLWKSALAFYYAKLREMFIFTVYIWWSNEELFFEEAPEKKDDSSVSDLEDKTVVDAVDKIEDLLSLLLRLLVPAAWGSKIV